MITLTETEALTKYGFNPQEKIQSREDFGKQLESYAIHVVEDLPVSNIYSYKFNPENQKIFTETGSEVFIDPEERDGFSLIGTIKALKMSLDNPGNLVFLYSPPGPVALRPGTKYDKVLPYQSGQLYVFKKRQGRENIIDAIALSVGKKYESQVLDIFFGENKVRFDDEIQKIVYYLSNPKLSGFKNFEELINKISEQSKLDFYCNVHGQEFNFSDVADFLRLGIEGKIKPNNHQVREIIDKIFKEKLSDNYYDEKKNPYHLSHPYLAYFSILSAYFNDFQQGIKLGGSCGGNQVTIGEIENFLNKARFNPLSVFWRLSTAHNLMIFESEINEIDFDKYGSREFECPHCKKKIRRPKDTLLDECPYCNKSVRCSEN